MKAAVLTASSFHPYCLCGVIHSIRCLCVSPSNFHLAKINTSFSIQSQLLGWEKRTDLPQRMIFKMHKNPSSRNGYRWYDQQLSRRWLINKVVCVQQCFNTILLVYTSVPEPCQCWELYHIEGKIFHSQGQCNSVKIRLFINLCPLVKLGQV